MKRQLKELLVGVGVGLTAKGCSLLQCIGSAAFAVSGIMLLLGINPPGPDPDVALTVLHPISFFVKFGITALVGFALICVEVVITPKTKSNESPLKKEEKK